MTRTSSSRTLLTVTALMLATPLSAQTAPSVMSAAQCDAMMMAGTQNYSPAAVAGCTAYFQTLARNATAPGTFSGSVLTVNASTSGSGG